MRGRSWCVFDLPPRKPGSGLSLGTPRSRHCRAVGTMGNTLGRLWVGQASTGNLWSPSSAAYTITSGATGPFAHGLHSRCGSRVASRGAPSYKSRRLMSASSDALMSSRAKGSHTLPSASPMVSENSLRRRVSFGVCAAARRWRRSESGARQSRQIATEATDERTREDARGGRGEAEARRRRGGGEREAAGTLAGEPPCRACSRPTCSNVVVLAVLSEIKRKGTSSRWLVKE